MREETLKTWGGFLIILIAAALISGGLFLIIKDTHSQSLSAQDFYSLGQPQFTRAYDHWSGDAGANSSEKNNGLSTGEQTLSGRGFSRLSWADLLKDFAGIVGIILAYSLGAAAFQRIGRRRGTRLGAD